MATSMMHTVDLGEKKGGGRRLYRRTDRICGLTGRKRTMYYVLKEQHIPYGNVKASLEWVRLPMHCAKLFKQIDAAVSGGRASSKELSA